MTGMNLIMGMGFIDDALVDEALNAEKAAHPIVFRRVLAAACVGLTLIGGILAARHFLPSESDPGGAPTQADNVRIEQPPTPSFTPERGNAGIVPPEETPTPTNDPQPQETIEPVQTDEPQPQATPAPQQTDSPRPRETTSPVQTNGPQSRETTAPVQTESPLPRETAVPEQTSTPSAGETPAPAMPSESWAVEPDPYPGPVGEYTYTAEESFYLTWHMEEDGVIALTLRSYQDYLPYRDYDSDYTGVRWEADGFELVTHDSWTNVEGFKLQLSPGQPEGLAADFAIDILDGEKTKTTLHFYGAMTDMGFFGGSTTSGLWVSYHEACFRAGRYIYSDLMTMELVIESTAEPMWEDPILTYDGPLQIIYLLNRDTDAPDEMPGGTHNEASESYIEDASGASGEASNGASGG